MARQVILETKSRNVKSYLRVLIELRKHEKAVARLKGELGHKRNKLNGGQMAEATRLSEQLGLARELRDIVNKAQVEKL